MTDGPSPKTPYVGLVPYDEMDADLFFGRDEEIRIVSSNLRASRLTILYGPSGVGKTSLLQAGVVHDLRRQILDEGAGRPARARFAVCVFRGWRDDPLPALMAAIGAAAAESRGRSVVRPWRAGTAPIAALRSWTSRVRTLLVVLDQFEEYFLYHPDEDSAGTFGGEFPAIVNEPNLRVNFLISIREDAWAKLDRFEGRIPRLFANYIRVEHLNRAAGRDAIERPIGEWNRRLPPGEAPYRLEGALVDAVLDAAGTGDLVSAEVGAGAPRPPGAADALEAPFLQLVMERLWRATLQAGEHELTLARLEALGGAQQIVENHLLEALGGLTRHEQELAADLFRFMVTRSKAKIAHPASDLAEWTGRPEAEVTAVLEKLSRGESGRILRPIPPPDESESTRYELFHDVLAEPILEWRRVFEEERARRAALRRFARIGGVLLTLVAVFAALGIWALVQRSDARRAARSASSLALAAAAVGQRDSHLDESLLLALEAYRASPTAQAASSMVGALETARSSGAETIVRGFPDGVRTVAYSPDGRMLAASSLHGAVRLWDLESRRPLGAPLGGSGEVWSVAFSPDGRILAFSGGDGAVRLWDVRSRSSLAELPAHQGRVDGVAFSPDGRTLASGGRDGTVRLWNVRDRAPLGAPLQGHTGRVDSVAFSPDGRTLASAGSDETVRLWDVRSGRSLGPPLRGHTGTIASVAFSPDGNTLASSDLDGAIRLWNVRTRAPLGHPLRGDAGEVWSVAFSPDGRTLASSGTDGSVRLWDVRTLEPLGAPLRGHMSQVDGVAFSPDGSTLASAGFDGTVRLWNVRTPDVLGLPLSGHTNQVKSVAFGPGGHVLASAADDGTVRLWDVAPHRELGAPLGAPTDGAVSSAFSPTSVAVSPDGRLIAVGSNDHAVWLFDARTRKPLGRPLRGHTDAVVSVAFSPDGHTLGSAGNDGRALLWDVRTRRPIGRPLDPHAGALLSVVFSPDGRTLASGGFDGMVRLWDVHRQRQLGLARRASSIGVLSIAVSPDGRTLASGSADGEVRLWDVRAWRPLGEPLSGGPSRVESVAFSPNGRVLASAGADGTIRLWDVRGRKPLGQPLRGHRGGVLSVAFSPDGRTLASGGADRFVRLWSGIFWKDKADLEAQVCSLVVGNLTRSEWTALAPGLPYRTTCP